LKFLIIVLLQIRPYKKLQTISGLRGWIFVQDSVLETL
jgi:hypothetical protein